MTKLGLAKASVVSAVLLACSAGVHAATVGSDTGSNYNATNPWVSGSNGGTGFNPWAFNGTTSNAVIGDSATVGGPVTVGTQAFGLVPAGADNSNFFAFRGFAGGSLADGQGFSGSMQVNFRDGLKGFSILDSSAANVAGVAVEGADYYFRVPGSTGTTGAKPDLLLSAVGTGNWGYDPDTVITLAATRVGNDLSVVVTRTGGLAASYTTTLVGAGVDANQFNIYSFGASSFSAEQIYYNNFAIVPEPASLGVLAVGGVGLLRRRRHA